MQQIPTKLQASPLAGLEGDLRCTDITYPSASSAAAKRPIWSEAGPIRLEKFVNSIFCMVYRDSSSTDGPRGWGTAAFGKAAVMADDDVTELKAQLARLRQEHRDLDAAIEALHNAPGSDLLQVKRLKKRKLHLRDRIIQIEDHLTPDIIA